MKSAIYNLESKDAVLPPPPQRDGWWRCFFDHSEDALIACRKDGSIGEANPRAIHAALRIAELYEVNLRNHLAAALEYE
ncbi:MAG TPA: hypothetical protein DCY13_12910, partial [Verrucomicrobiales bacterium]|nr:hypothetical protein [Verrucomicrobiales bacterium]